jgi:hypothetical protein
MMGVTFLFDEAHPAEVQKAARMAAKRRQKSRCAPAIPSVTTDSLRSWAAEGWESSISPKILDFAWSRDGKRLAIARATTTTDIILFRGVKPGS